ncbi:DivIVA domain-containing protein [Jatrophihabitans endophyticus]|uniref:DivIVA domain-containing protein n=1 Tax=Jatrophihabitans endophyticus TaxID=1206085 RepID=UPI0019FE613C|nr:DivIVA domain-containing protein [Jatrophihabitans endophyticus]MBE7188806.1 DivIVA domain-containing protein [Jatrophihabitans endophyticus]
MPLTPAEVHNVAFKKPPIGKRGYDEEEVDAFLDIVEVELSRLIEENNDLRSRGANGAQANGTAETQAVSTSKAGADPAELAAAHEENTRLNARIGELEKALNQGKDGAQQQVVALQQQLHQTETQLNENRAALEQAQSRLAEAQQAAEQARSQQGSAPAAAATAADSPATSDHHLQAVQMLALAQQTADQHLSQSKAEAERLVSEAQANAQQTVSDANDKSTRQLADADSRAKKMDEDSAARAAQTVQDAEQRAATITAQFEQRKAALERRVEELRTFEREYRTRLKSYLESQLRDLDASGKAEPSNPNSDYAEAQQG